MFARLVNLKKISSRAGADEAERIGGDEGERIGREIAGEEVWLSTKISSESKIMYYRVQNLAEKLVQLLPK